MTLPSSSFMRVLNVPMDDLEYAELLKAKERAEYGAKRALTWREFLAGLSNIDPPAWKAYA